MPPNDKPQATKEQLIAKVAELELQLKQVSEKDAIVRDRLSYVLNLATVKSDRWGGEENIERSWIELFCEIGKLIAKRDYVSFTDRINDIDSRIIQTFEEMHFIREHFNDKNRS